MTIKKEPDDNIENRNVKVKISTAVLIIMSTISIIISIMTTYYSLRSDIKDVSVKADLQKQLNDLRFQNDETKINENHEWLRTLSHRINLIEQQKGIKPTE
ncbi:hypothetical protein [Mucilaginibacter ginkgonis]|uniref:Uncharacterized protein n=1 Tax=Mucilaginibacter ginkgonis TaxID=2682091 RepID=A0A6I4HVS8_9SPHI|nr:hypothetical protein [Mucilaginibacter ginkgonis]QQL50324.1 hypothetical protein GO620_002395 [Mucilaginibacter ginkgonis]